MMEMEISQIKATLIDKFRRSEYAERVRVRIQEITSIVSILARKLAISIQKKHTLTAEKRKTKKWQLFVNPNI